MLYKNIPPNTHQRVATIDNNTGYSTRYFNPNPIATNSIAYIIFLIIELILMM